MKLCYHTGKNFGDALNPIIFDHFLPGFCDENTETILLGIGSILGLKRGFENTKRKIVFTSGYANGQPGTYGDPPQIDGTYDIICVRGPLTAKLLGIDSAKAIADGGLLMKGIISFPAKKKYKYSLLLHHSSESYFEWSDFLNGLDIHFISTKGDPLTICREITESEFVIAEAMHGAIIADTLRVPWISINCYNTINQFKWNDFTRSMELEYAPIRINAPFGFDFLKRVSEKKETSVIAKNIWLRFKTLQSKYHLRKKTAEGLRKIKAGKFYLSTDILWDRKYQQLVEKIELLKNRYST